MSLREFGVFNPLSSEHPSVGESCWKCNCVLSVGTRTALCPIETPEQSGSLNVEAKLVCATCHLKGAEIETPRGSRTVDTIKEGDGSPYPIVTTDGLQWRDKDIWKVNMD